MNTAQELIDLSIEIGELVAEKNEAYGDSVRKSAKIMQILYPNGVTFDQIPGMLLTARVLDKLSRIANDPTYGGEDPAKDITGYGLLWQELIKNGLWHEQSDVGSSGGDTPGGLRMQREQAAPGVCGSSYEGSGGTEAGVHVRELCDGAEPEDVCGEADSDEEVHVGSAAGEGSGRPLLAALAKVNSTILRRLSNDHFEGAYNKVLTELDRAIMEERGG